MKIEHIREEELGRLILQLANTIIKNRNHHLKSLGLTTSQADSLQFFISYDNASVTDLKNEFGITHQTASGIVQRMADKGLLEVNKSKTDSRYQIVKPTQKGIELNERLDDNKTQTAGRILDKMTMQDQTKFVRLLKTALDNVKYE